jgi:predicted N-acetyltransferase YhbS
VTAPPGPAAVARRPVERLRLADLDDCVALAADRDWAPEPRKWRLLFEVGEVYGIRDPAGALAGTVTVTAYGGGLAAVGMMLVAARYNRQGLGRALMTHALARTAGTVTMLFATGPGRPLYERMGFRPADVSARYIGPVTPAATAPAAGGPAAGAPASGLRPATPADWPAIAELDRRAFGADRRAAVLDRLPGLAERLLVLSGPAGTGSPAARNDTAESTAPAIRAYGAARPHLGHLLIGPVVADTPAGATALIAALAAGDARPARIEIPGQHPGLARWAAAAGLELQSRTTVMVHGGDRPGQPGQVYAPFDVAMG